MAKKWLSILLEVTLSVSMTACGQSESLGSVKIDEESSTDTQNTVESTSERTEAEPIETENNAITSVPVFDFEKKTVMLNSGYEMPIAGLGTYALSDEECYNSVTVLLENGGRLIDTASVYGNEASVGRAVRDSDVPREEICVTKKLYPNQFADAEGAINEALEKMDIEYIDLMLLHPPGTGDVKAYKALEQAV